MERDGQIDRDALCLCTATVEATNAAGSTDDLAELLKRHYAYGFKYDSVRERMRLRRFADAMGVVLPEGDETLRAAILSTGTVIDDKVYYRSKELTAVLRCMVGSIFSTGVRVIYYENLFERERDRMDAYGIVSTETLKGHLKKSIPGCFFAKRFMVEGCGKSEQEAVTDELKRVWGAHPTEDVRVLHERLPYIPLDNLRRVISGNELFALAAEGEYLFIDRFHMGEDEERSILAFVESACERDGYASWHDVPLGGIEEENYELSRLTIWNAIYKKVLSGKFYLNGKILTKEKTKLDVVALLKRYIEDRKECGIDALTQRVAELTGSRDRRYALRALYDDMVRVDQNRFVDDRSVEFPVEEIDAVLDSIVTDQFCALRDVTTFALFPLCGQNWNRYLLESYCYRYSRKYSLHVLHFNDKNAGIIARRDFKKNYHEMLALALVKAKVELQPEPAGAYLADAGYLATSKYAKLDEVIRLAGELRKER